MTRNIMSPASGVPRESPENAAEMAKCWDFEHCDAPKCPADALLKYRVFYPGEPRCKAKKAHRLRLWGHLLGHGLFPAELAGILRYYGTWDAFLMAKGKKYGLVPAEGSISRPEVSSAQENAVVMPRGCLT